MKNTDTSRLYVEEHAVRLVAAQVVLLTLAVLVFQWKYLALLLALDFALRAFTYFPSPLALVAKTLTGIAGWQRKPIFAPPKKFAAGIGFVFSLSIFFFFHYGLPVSAYLAGGVLVFCAVLESAFRICLGCHVYNWIVIPVFGVSEEFFREKGNKKGG